MKRPQLFLLHFAGGNCYSFNFLETFLKRHFDVVPLELPGRGNRIQEKLLYNFEEAVLDIQQQVLLKMTSPDFFIFGHSLGSYLGLRVVNRLIERGQYPACLIVSGSSGPRITTKRTSQLSQQEFINELQILGGTPPEVFENDELLEYFEPILRADFAISEENDLVNEPALTIPLFALMGNQENDVNQICNWQRYTHHHFEYKIFEGAHFFIHNHSQSIAQFIKQSYDTATLL